ncbi:hypothetical protein Sjap_003557 [Stephania japonica]|uniref:Growth-regulating factor n=1 Tax=Stephania japonica TaxID=461633 RepID=A0AAP0KR23_9MAGN
MDAHRLCRAHHLQARHRQDKHKVPNSLKLQRKPNPSKKTKLGYEEDDSLGHHLLQERVLAKISRSIDSGRSIELIERLFGEGLVIGRKRKLGELLLELVRVFLEREVEKKKKVRLESGFWKEEVMLDLPNGVMSISPLVPAQPIFGNAGSVCDWKLGLCSDSLMRRRVRSKNIEPIQFGSCKVFPCGRSAAGLKKVGEENCIKAAGLEKVGEENCIKAGGLGKVGEDNCIKMAGLEKVGEENCIEAAGLDKVGEEKCIEAAGLEKVGGENCIEAVGLKRVGEENFIKDCHKSRYSDMPEAVMIQIQELPDNLRCSRTDGRQWRCSQRAMDDRRFCEAHFLQAYHRQYKQKVPEYLKFQRKPKQKTILRKEEDSPGHHLHQE